MSTRTIATKAKTGGAPKTVNNVAVEKSRKMLENMLSNKLSSSSKGTKVPRKTSARKWGGTGAQKVFKCTCVDVENTAEAQPAENPNIPKGPQTQLSTTPPAPPTPPTTKKTTPSTLGGYKKKKQKSVIKSAPKKK